MPFKVCRSTAEDIKRNVRRTLDVLPKLPPEVIKHMKIAAERDAQFHREYDEHFLMGSGPASERRG